MVQLGGTDAVMDKFAVAVPAEAGSDPISAVPNAQIAAAAILMWKVFKESPGPIS